MITLSLGIKFCKDDVNSQLLEQETKTCCHFKYSCTCIVLSWYPHKPFNLRSFSVLPSCRSFLMDMAESNQTLLLMVLEYGDQVWSMISFCFLFFCFCFCLFFFFKSKQWAQFPLISHVRTYSFPIRDILSFHRRNRDSLPEHWLAIKPPLQTFFWLVTQSSPTNDVRRAVTRDEPKNVCVGGY